MDFNPFELNVTQSSLFSLEKAGPVSMELTPEIWSAAQTLISPNSDQRYASLQRLEELGVIQYSPLVVYLVSSCITDPDLNFRAKVVEVLAKLIGVEARNQVIPDDIRNQLRNSLSRMRTREIISLLQVAQNDSACTRAVATLMDMCPYAGKHLADILIDRDTSLAIRKLAILMIGEVGFLDALSTLERLHNRLEARINGQQTLGFTTRESNDELILLPSLCEALKLLRAP